MPTVDETVAIGQGRLAASLREGIAVISQNAEITFVPYVKFILPLDGYVFWINATLLSPIGLMGLSPLNVGPINQFYGNLPSTALQSFTVPGSLHISTINQQDEDESFSVNRVVFTTQTPINDLNEISPSVMYIAQHADFKYAFSQRSGWYWQADTYHYSGDAVYPVLESQIIDNITDFDGCSLIASNSIPIWLALNKFMPVYPSYLVSDNIRPPYAAVHIPEDATEPLQAMPLIDGCSNHYQLVSDKVRITIYGTRNFDALAFQDYVIQQSLYNPQLFGIMDTPIIKDVKRTQTEISAIAQKKSFVVKINYYQTAVRNLARQLILTAIPNVVIAN